MPEVVFVSGLRVAVSKRSIFQALGCAWVGLTGGGVKGVILKHRIVFGSGLHVVVSKSCNFQASGCVLVGLTCCCVEKLLFSGIGLCLGRAYTCGC